MTQAASSFVNRVSPANIGGMALNARFLQKSGVPPGAGVAAVGVNALMGAVAHLILLVIFFTLAGHQLAHAFKLPPASKLLLILAVAAALAGIALATRRGRRLAKTRLLPGLRSAAASLRTVAASPVKLTLLAGGSALITVAYIGGLAASVQAFGGHAGITETGAVCLGAAVIAAASPTPGCLGAIEAKTAKLAALLDASEAAHAQLPAGSEAAGTLTAPDPAGAFDAAPLGAQRALTAFLMTVRLDPAPADATSMPSRCASSGGATA